MNFTKFPLFFCIGASFATTPQTEPLVMPSDVAYLGSFALPTETNGTSRFGYGGHGIAPYHDPITGKRTLFMEGHVQNPGQVAQIEVPSTLSKSTHYEDLPVAAWVQAFHPIYDHSSLEALTGTTTDNGVILYGMMVWNGRLIVSPTEYYGTTQKKSHGASGLNLSVVGDITAFGQLTAAASSNVRSTSGPMTAIPSEWRSLLGGPALTGNWGNPIISGSSAGPAISVFNPDNVGIVDPIPSQNLLYYPVGPPDKALCITNCNAISPETTQNSSYNLATVYAGMAFPSGSRSVLFFGRQGTGPYCYGTDTECSDPAEGGDKGPHAYPYQYQVWGYDANDLLAVKNGAKNPWDVKPYGTAAVPILDAWTGTGGAKVVSAAYDNETRCWFVTTNYGENPRVDVFQIRTF